MKNLQGEREREGGGEKPYSTPHVGIIKTTIMLIKGTASPIIMPLAKVIRAIKPSCERQGNWDHAKVLALIKC